MYAYEKNKAAVFLITKILCILYFRQTAITRQQILDLPYADVAKNSLLSELLWNSISPTNIYETSKKS